jgi:hypothetical protein
MPMHPNHGLLVLHDEADGTTSLSICARVIDGKPRDVYARYHRAPRVEVDADVALTRRGRTRFTTEIVEVTSFDDGVVNVRYPRYDDLA